MNICMFIPFCPYPSLLVFARGHWYLLEVSFKDEWLARVNLTTDITECFDIDMYYRSNFLIRI